MTDNEITREKTFSEELPHFKERIKEVFDNYDNPNGNEDPLYIAVLRDSHRIVRKAEEEINRQQAEYNNLLEQFRVLDCECGRLEKADENQKAEIERLKKTEIEINDFCRRLCRMRMLNGNAIASYEDLQNYIQEAKSEAVKEFVNKLKEKVYSVYSIRDLHKTIDNLAKEMIGENNA